MGKKYKRIHRVPIDYDVYYHRVPFYDELILHNNLLKLMCFEYRVSKLDLNDNLIYLNCKMTIEINNINNKKLKINFVI